MRCKVPGRHLTFSWSYRALVSFNTAMTMYDDHRPMSVFFTSCRPALGPWLAAGGPPDALSSRHDLWPRTTMLVFTFMLRHKQRMICIAAKGIASIGWSLQGGHHLQ